MNLPASTPTNHVATQDERSKRSKPFAQLKDLKPRADVKGGWSSQQASSNGASQTKKIIGGG